jgi:hypothetical protein
MKLFDLTFFNAWDKAQIIIARLENAIDNNASEQAALMVSFSLRPPGKTVLRNVGGAVKRIKIQ